MDAEGEKKPRKARAKTPRRGRKEKGRKNLLLSADAQERVRSHAHREGKTESAVVEELIQAHLTRYVVHDMRAGAAASDAA